MCSSTRPRSCAGPFAATARRFGFTCTARGLRAVNGRWLIEAYRRLDPGSDASARRAFHVDYVRERVMQLRACPGVRDTLAAARAAGVRIGAATSHGEIAEACLVSTRLYPLIDCLVTPEDVKRPKPHPESILRAISLLGGDPRDPTLDAIHVGDTAVDIEAGKAAGTRTAGVTYGMSTEAEIRAAGPDLVVHQFPELRARLTAPARACEPRGVEC